MKQRLIEYRQSFARRLNELLWRQWDALGVAGVVAPEAKRLIDPEALLLISATLARWDARLFDEVLDWVLRNGRFISGNRLKRLLEEYEFTGGRVLAVFADQLKKKDRRRNWKMAYDKDLPTEDLFFSFSDGKPMQSFGGHLDPTFAEFGFQRGRLELRGYSKAFIPEMPVCLWLRLRALFGVNSRSDFFAYLLTTDHGNPSGIARKTGYTQKSAQDTLSEMAASGFLHQTRKGREVLYRLKPSTWKQLMFSDHSAPAWLPWVPLFRAIEIIWLKLYDTALYEHSDLGLASELFEIMKQVRPLLDQSGISHQLSPSNQGLGDDYLQTFEQDLDTLLDYACGGGDV